jgi:ribonuclease PH
VKEGRNNDSSKRSNGKKERRKAAQQHSSTHHTHIRCITSSMVYVIQRYLLPCRMVSFDCDIASFKSRNSWSLFLSMKPVTV